MRRRASTFIGHLCRHGHFGERYSSSGECVECVRLRSLAPSAIERRKRHDHDHPDRCVARVRRYQATTKGRASSLWHSAHSRSETVTITVEWIEKRLARGVCEVSGLPFNFSRSVKMGPYSPSLDRIDTTAGYTPQNCRIILWALNAAFSHWGADTFEPIATAWLARSAAGPAVESRVAA